MSYSSFKLLDQTRPIVIFGRDGQVGKALQICLKDLRIPVVFLGRSDCDLSNESAIRDEIERYQPQVIINAAAYTAVDKAESERELAFAVNANAPAVMAHYIANMACGILVHYSTDYVFSDRKQTAYLESDCVGPVEKLNVYGQSKLAGEQAVQEIFSQVNSSESVSSYKPCQDRFSRYYILRTSWVYGNGDNFIRTMLRLAGERDELKVVADQVGTPSSAEWLAEVGLRIVESMVESGIYHAVPDGETSWHDLAVVAIETAASCGKGVEIKTKKILPISAVDYPSLAPRPHNSRLSNAKLKKALSEMGFTGQYPHWHEQVRAYVKGQYQNQ